MNFNEYLAEQLEDPEFREAYERISAEEDEKLVEAMKREAQDLDCC